MSRWNITHLVFYSKHGEIRSIEFNKGVTIITGGSATGKSAIIDSIDYCLGSSSSRIASFITERITHVGCKWKNRESEFYVAREVAKTGKSSSRMFIDYGTEIEIPNRSQDLKGTGNKDSIKNVLEHLFGITEEISPDATSSKISVRYITPFIFLDKEVIDSRNTLMHHLDDRIFAKNFTEALPYFLGAMDEEELDAMKRQSLLIKAIDFEEKRKLQFENNQSKIYEDGFLLLNEARQFKIVPENEIPITREELFNVLKKITLDDNKMFVHEDAAILENQLAKKGEILSRLNELKTMKRLAKANEEVASDFSLVLDNQLAKLDVQKFFKHSESNCPICNSEMPSPTQQSKRIYESISILEKERVIVSKHKPNVSKYLRELDHKIYLENNELKKVETSITSLIKESEVITSRLHEFQQAARVVGRISYYLENKSGVEHYNMEKYENYKAELDNIGLFYGKSERTEKIEIAQRKISDYATKNLVDLPKGPPCDDARIDFFLKGPKIIITDKDQKSLDFASVGSDENYLSIHLALAFAFQKFLGKRKASVPAVLILDQVSRPYYSNSDEERDVRDENTYRDDDRLALAKHFDFIFNQVENDEDLQVIVLEHAYLGSNKKFRDATKYKWPKSGTEKLIPSSWPKTV